MTYYTIITDIGLNKIATTHKSIELTALVVGDGGGKQYNPDEGMTRLKNEVYKTKLDRLYSDDKNKNQLIAESLISEDVGGFTIREIGLLDSDGDLFAIGNYPTTHKPHPRGSFSKDLYIRMILGFSCAPNVELKIDPSVSFLTFNDAKKFANYDLSNVSGEYITSRIPIPSETFNIGCPVGVVFSYAGYSIPRGFLPLNGKAIGAKNSEADYKGEQYKPLYTFLSTNVPPSQKIEESQSFINWDSGQTIILPNLCGRSVIGAGKGDELTHRDLLSNGGKETHTLSTEEMPSHTHNAKQYKVDDKNMRLGTHKGRNLGGFHAVEDKGDATSPTGGNQPHNNMPPWVAMNYIIKY